MNKTEALKRLTRDDTEHGVEYYRVDEVDAILAQPEQPLPAIRALIEQCAALVWERDELKKQIQQYEKSGVTCQTYRHKVGQSCAECNVHETYTTPTVLPEQEPDLNFYYHTDAVAVLTEEGWIWDGDQWQRPALPEQEPVVCCGDYATCMKPCTPRGRWLAEQEPGAWHNKIVGMEVSMDVSTGEDDAHHRVFGRVCEVMLEAFGATNDTILAIEDSRNFTTPPKRTWVELTDEQIEQRIGYRLPAYGFDAVRQLIKENT